MAMKIVSQQQYGIQRACAAYFVVNLFIATAESATHGNIFYNVCKCVCELTVCICYNIIRRLNFHVRCEYAEQTCSRILWLRGAAENNYRDQGLGWLTDCWWRVQLGRRVANLHELRAPPNDVLRMSSITYWRGGSDFCCDFDSGAQPGRFNLSFEIRISRLAT